MIIDAIWRRQPGDYFYLCTKSSGGTFKEHAFKRGERVGEFIKDNSDKNIWFCPHGFRSDPKTFEVKRRKDLAVPPKLLWADLDEADPREFDAKWKPTMAWESSPGRFVGIWVTDQTVDDELNRRLSYHLGADKGGWDYTQLLRIPGCINYKYASMPKVRLLWDNGHSVKKSDYQSWLPEQVTIESSDAGEIYKKYEKKIPAWLRRELLATKEPPVGKRSDMLWKIQSTLIECGLSREETFALSKQCVWNKFKGKSSEDDQLMRELDKIIDGKVTGSGTGIKLPKDTEKKEYGWLERTMDEVEEANIDWVWYPYLARGELTILEGDPEAGKSYLAMIAAMHICDGKALPSDKPRKVPVQGKVAYFDLENDAGTVTKKRLLENGISQEGMKNFHVEEEGFSIDDEDKFARVMDAVGKLKPVLAVFDTLNTYIGSADTYKASESQQALGNFRTMAKTHQTAVIVLRHLNKSSKGPAMYRGQGSIAFAGLARVVMTVGRVPEDKTEIAGLKGVTVTKFNLGPKPKAMTYTIDSLPDTLKSQDRSKFTWHDSIDLTSDEMLSETNLAGSGDTKQDKCAEWLERQLQQQDMEAAKVESMSEAQGWKLGVLKRAAEKLEVYKFRDGFQGPWKWTLRAKAEVDAERNAEKLARGIKQK